MEVFKCKNGTKIHFRYPNVAEHFKLKHHSKLGSGDAGAFMMVGGILANCSAMIQMVEGGKHDKWENVLNDHTMVDDLSEFAVKIYSLGISDAKKKPSEPSEKT